MITKFRYLGEAEWPDLLTNGRIVTSGPSLFSMDPKVFVARPNEASEPIVFSDSKRSVVSVANIYAVDTGNIQKTKSMS